MSYQALPTHALIHIAQSIQVSMQSLVATIGLRDFVVVHTGDATLIASAGGRRVLVDGGPSGDLGSGAAIIDATLGSSTIQVFANALVETSLPGVMIVLLASRMDPQLVFGFWPPLLYFIFILLSTLRLDFWLSLWTGLVAAVQLYVLAAHFHDLNFLTGEANQSPFYHLSRSAVLLLAGVVAGLVAVRLRRQFENSAAAAATRDRVTSLFGQHVSPAVVERLLSQATDPPSEMRSICVLFLDIRGFTARSESIRPEEIIQLLNRYFEEMGDAIAEQDGHPAV